jgi:hypothetical protein
MKYPVNSSHATQLSIYLLFLTKNSTLIAEMQNWCCF